MRGFLSRDFWTNEISSLWLSRFGGVGTGGGAPPISFWDFLDADAEGNEVLPIFGGALASLMVPDDAY